MSKFQRLFFTLLLVFLSILSISGTIALRNLLHLIMLFMILWCLIWAPEKLTLKPMTLARKVPLPVWLWCAYLMAFPLIAPMTGDAWSNLFGKGMWGESILTWMLAWGAILILGQKQLTLWLLALVSAVPVFIHLGLTLLSWANVLQPQFFEAPSLQTAGLSVIAVLRDPALILSPFQGFPFPFRGIEPMHGNLGYPASQAMCLGLAVMYFAWQQADRRMAIKAGALVAMCFISVVIARSRAAAYFGLLIVALSIGLYVAFVRVRNSPRHLGLGVPVGVLSIAAICLALFVQVVAQNPVWYSMADKVIIGFQVDKPKEHLCDGVSPNTLEFVRQQHVNKDEAYVDSIIDGLRSDGGRALLARVGVELSAMYPWGWNGGRNAYEYRIEQLCGHVPVMQYSHAHNAWINLILALGWAGAILYVWVFLYFASVGKGMLKHQIQWPVGMALMLLSSFWVLRGMVDAVFQEHYLQMQASALMFVWLNNVEVERT